MAKFAYFTATNNSVNNPMISTLIHSARKAGVTEDFHVFSPQNLVKFDSQRMMDADQGPTEHLIESNYPWRNHMAKMDFLKQMKGLGYEYVVWLDADTYFVRHPGDLSSLIRGNKCWVSMECEFTAPGFVPRVTGWWTLGFPDQIATRMRALGCGQRLWNTNGGMFIVRDEAIDEFAASCESSFKALRPQHPTIADEPPLAIAGMTMVPDPELNTLEHYKDVWAIDWSGRIYKDVLPDGKPWLYEDWLGGAQCEINPAIVHAMGSKAALMIGKNIEPPAPVGTKLSEIIAECGIQKPEGCSCDYWITQMNQWGIDGCAENRKAILHHLAEVSDEGSWMDMVKAAKKGYVSLGSMLNEAIRRAKNEAAA